MNILTANFFWLVFITVDTSWLKRDSRNYGKIDFIKGEYEREMMQKNAAKTKTNRTQ